LKNIIKEKMPFGELLLKIFICGLCPKKELFFLNRCSKKRRESF